MARAKATQENGKATSLSAWKAAAVHYPMLPSGVRIGIRIPDLAEMIETGKVPNDLLETALGMAKAQQGGDDTVPTIDEMIKTAGDDRAFTDLMVLASVVDPEITEADVQPGGIPQEDKQFITAVATRQRDLDAEGEHIAGLSKSEKFRRFRRLGDFDENVEGL